MGAQAAAATGGDVVGRTAARLLGFARAGAFLGRELTYEEETLEEAYASRRAAYGAPDWQLDAWVSTYTAIADGSVAHVSDDVRRVTGNPPRTLEQALAG